MFSRLREHANHLEKDIQTMEKTLEFKLKSLFSIVETEASESSLTILKSIISELNDINSHVVQMTQDSINFRNDFVTEYAKYWDKMDTLINQLTSMEIYLVEFGYTTDGTILSSEKYTHKEDNSDRE